jgi:hypothetical protein
MKYIIQAEIDPETGAQMEADMKKIQEWVGEWQSLKPIGMYFATTRRAITIILDAPSEDAFFEALHATWVLTKSYPDVWPVVSAEEFPAIAERSGLVR